MIATSAAQPPQKLPGPNRPVHPLERQSSRARTSAVDPQKLSGTVSEVARGVNEIEIEAPVGTLVRTLALTSDGTP